jgi:6-pyruvoyltetrahydropterin/6-carboxytetrahydropterin synthase
VKVTGEVDMETGYLIDLKILKTLIKEEVIEPFDHRNLNLDVPDFQHKIPSAENIAYVIWHKLRKRLNASMELSVVLYETERNFIEYYGK